jgi:NAD(P)-dependent dehydrogenase (short-subunit alcohol dehydrogenase family)
MTKMSLKGKIAVVTGSAKGIGFAILKEYAENNDITVIVCSRVFKKQRK